MWTNIPQRMEPVIPPPPEQEAKQVVVNKEEAKRQWIADRWAEEEALTLEQHRQRYINPNFVTIKEVAPWTIQQISAGKNKIIKKK